MSRSIDERIVQMSFNNDGFERGVKDTLNSLDNLDKSTSRLTKNLSNTNFNGLANAADSIKVKWSPLQSIMDGFFKSIGEGFANAGKKVLDLINPLDDIGRAVTRTFDIIKSKGWTRAANLENAQFQLKGLGIAWEQVGNQINAAVDGTAYGLDSAAKAAAQLAASGVKIGEGFREGVGEATEAIDEMERALGAISGVAAMTNSTYDEIADIFTDAAGRGKVSADTFNRIAQRGLNASATLAKALGVTETQVRDLASKGKISFQTFADAMYDAYYTQAKKSNETFDGSLANMQAALGRIGAMFATPLRSAMIEPFNQLRMLINRVKAELVPFADHFTKIINIISKGFSEFVGGIGSDKLSFIGDLAEGFQHILESILLVLIPVKDGLKDLFPGSFTDTLKEVSTKFKDFTLRLRPTADQMMNIRKAVYAVGIIFRSLKEIIVQVISSFVKVDNQGASLITVLSGIISTITAVIAVGLKWIADNQIIAKGLQVLITCVKTLAMVLGSLLVIIGGGLITGFTKLKTIIKEFVSTISDRIGAPGSNPFVLVLEKIKTGIENFIKSLPDALQSLKKFFTEFQNADSLSEKLHLIFERLLSIKDRIVEVVNNIKDSIKQLFSSLSQYGKNGLGASLVGSTDLSKLSEFTNKIKEFVKNLDFGKIAVIGFVASLLLLFNQIRKTLKSVTDLSNNANTVVNAFKGIASSISGMFNKTGDGIKGFLDSLADAQKQKTTINDVANALLKLAGAVAIISGIILVFTKMDNAKLLESATTLAKIAAGIVIFSGALAILNKAFDLSFLTRFSVALMLMSASILILATAFNKLEATGDTNATFEKLGTLGILMIELGAMAAVLSKAAPSLTKGAIFLVAFALSVKLLASVLNNMPDLTGPLMELGLLAVGVMAISKVLSNGLSTLAKGMLAFGTMVLEISSSMLLIILAIKLINGISQPEIDYAVNNLAMIMALLGLYGTVMSIVVGRLGKDMPKFGALLITTAAAVAILSIVIEKLGSLEPDVCKQGTNAVLELLVAFGVLELLSAATEKARPVKFAASLILITGCIALLGGISALLGLINPKQMWKGIGAVAALVTLVGALMVVSKFTEKANTKAIISTLVSIEILFATMIRLSLVKDWDGILKAVITMGVIMVAFGTMLRNVSKYEFKTKNIVGMIACAVIVAEIALALVKLSKYDWKSLLSAGLAMTSVLFIYTKILETISSRTGLKPNKIVTFLAASLALIPVAASIALIAKYNWESLAASGAALSLALMAYVASLKIISSTKIDLASIGAFLLGTLSVIPIAFAISQIAEYPWQNVLASAAAMSLAIIAISGALALLSAMGGGIKALASGGAILIVSAGLILLANALIKFNEVDWNSLAQAGLALAGITAAIALLGLLGPYALIGAAAIFVVCAALDLLAVAIIGAAVGVAMFLPSLQILSTMDLAGLGSQLMTLAGGLTLFASACLVLTLAAPGLIVGALTLPSLAAALQQLAMVGDLSSIAMYLAQIGAGCMVLGLAGPGMISASVGMTLMAAAINLLAPAVSKLATVFATSMIKIQTSFNLMSSKMVLQGTKMGVNTASGMVNGITSGIPNVVKAGATMATNFINKIKNVLGIHSPSRIMQQIGKYCGIGFDEGSTDATIWNGIGQKIKGLLNDKLLTPAKTAGAQVKETITNAMSGLDGLSKYTDKFKDITSGTNFLGTFTSAEDAMKSLNLTAEDGESIFDSFGLSLDGVTDSLGSTGKAAGETKTEFEKLSETIAGQIDLFSEFSAKTEMTSQQLIHNMESQINGVTNWANMMDTLGDRGINQGLLQYLGNLGPQGYEYVNAFVNMTDEELQHAGELFEQSLMLPDAASSKVIGSYQKAGKNYSLGAAKGIKDGAQQVDAEVAAMAESSLETLQTGWDEHSPSRITRQYGAYFVEGMELGITDEKLTLFDFIHQLAYGACTKLSQGITENLGMIQEAVSSISTTIQDSLTEGLSGDSDWVSNIIPETATATVTESATLLGQSVCTGLTTGITNLYATVTQKAQELIKSIIQVMQLQLQYGSGRSQQTYMFGQGIANGLTAGMKAGEYSVISEARTICNSTISTFSNNITYAKFYQYGRYVSEGFAAGMESCLDRIEAAAQRMVKAAEEAVEAEAKIKSPSRLFKAIGKYIPQGFAIGIEEDTHYVAEAGENMVNVLEEAISSIADTIDADMDMSPTITPVLDMSQLQNGVSDINSMFNKSVAINTANAQAANITRSTISTKDNADADNTSTGNNFVFTQNNYSPKALTRSEIYRQTKNQFSQMKGMVASI